MIPSLYTSAVGGNVAELRQHEAVLDEELTPNRNTVLHVAAQFGHLDYVKAVLEVRPSLLHKLNNKNETPLHTAAREGHAEIVKAMIAHEKRLEEDVESGLVGAVKKMLGATNHDGDTALHMAARYCHLEGEKYLKVFKLLTKKLELGRDREVVKIEITKITKLDGEEVEKIMRDIKEVEEIIRVIEVDRDTALHKAAKNRLENENRDTYLEVVKLLSKEHAEFQHPPNIFQETPLYLAAERGIMGVAIVDTLVETYKSLETDKSLEIYRGPCGRTALHAAALKDFTGQSTKKLLEWKKDLINQADEYGWTPLHYVACKKSGEGVRELLSITTANKDDQDAATTSNGNENGVREQLATDGLVDTALHIAAAHGHVSVMKELLSYNPDCWEMVNSKGQNVLHIAVDMNRDSVISFILRDYSWVGQLINQKDNEGNTPLHLLIASDCDTDELWMHHRADHHAFNGKNMTPVDLVWSNLMEERMSTFAETHIMDDTFLNSAGIGGGRNLACNAHVNLAKLEKARRHEKQKRKMTEDAENRRKYEAKRKENDDAFELSVKLFQTIVIVAALIATITFAAAFTIPGGYDGNKDRDQGMAILARESAFKVFVITNTIAMVCSVTSIFLCLTAMGYSLSAEKEASDHYGIRYNRAMGLIIVSMFFVMIAFIAATFAVLAHAIALAVSTCIIACFAFIGYIVELRKFVLFFLSSMM